ncbi:MAG TPA: enoyl-CoA hydratase/isomerase family protein [Kofleriaceae bacterium]|jgi:enoyl-CoA hydratase/carnithine racemase
MANDDAVTYEARGDIGVITLNRPDNRNSMTPEVLDCFAKASWAAKSDANTRCVIVTGTGSCFSAGADFKSSLQREDETDDKGKRRSPDERSYAMYEPFLSLLDIDVPVIAACQGHAVGGGFGLALVCDVRIVAKDAKYGANFTAIGLSPGMAISYLLPRLVGVGRANEMLLTGRLIKGDEAERIGLANRAVDAAEVMKEAEAMARAIADNAPFAVKETKKAIYRGLTFNSVTAVKDAARAEAHVQAISVGMDDVREGTTALLEKRKPTFTGK